MGHPLLLLMISLTKEEKPFVGSERDKAKVMYGDELSPDLRDPRLSQTICMPGQDLRPNGEFVFKLPPLNEESRNQIRQVILS